ncbi:MAG: hypothetical protein ACR2LK_03440 [Solirubrobacteraceae bacterium]
MSVRFLFTTLQFEETDGYARVGAELERLGHDVAHLVASRAAARALRARGIAAALLPDRLTGLGPLDYETEVRRIEHEYPIPSLRDVWISDPVCRGRGERWCLERTVRHVVALERLFAELRPDVVIPEVGSETVRTVAHLVAGRSGATRFFVFFTIFPRPLRLGRDDYDAPIVPSKEVRELGPEERAEVEAFVDAYIRRDRPTLAHRRPRITPAKLRDFARHNLVKLTLDRDNEYLHPLRFVRAHAAQRARSAAIARLYEPVPDTRPFVYFPLHVTDDFKVKRVIPHCVDQGYLVEQIADALPQGFDLVLKEHPVSLGRNSVGFLRRLVRRPNVRLVDAYTSSHELIRRARAVAVISSTVGLEALLHGQPVLTIGRPFYSGYGVTLDVESFRELREAVPALLRYRPDRERTLRFLHAAMRSTYEGAPAGVDRSEENGRRLARSLDRAARDAVPVAAHPALP